VHRSGAASDLLDEFFAARFNALEEFSHAMWIVHYLFAFHAPVSRHLRDEAAEDAGAFLLAIHPL
jgi:hypothetical protein